MSIPGIGDSDDDPGDAGGVDDGGPGAGSAVGDVDGGGVPPVPSHAPMYGTAPAATRNSPTSRTPRCHIVSHIWVAAAGESLPLRSWSMACMWRFQVVIAVRALSRAPRSPAACCEQDRSAGGGAGPSSGGGGQATPRRSRAASALFEQSIPG